MINFHNILSESRTSFQTMRKFLNKAKKDSTFQKYENALFAMKMTGNESRNVSNSKRLIDTFNELPEFKQLLHSYLLGKYGNTMLLYRGLTFKSQSAPYKRMKRNKVVTLKSFSKRIIFEWTQNEGVAREFTYIKHFDDTDKLMPFGILLQCDININNIIYSYDPVGKIIGSSIDHYPQEEGVMVLHDNEMQAQVIKVR